MVAYPSWDWLCDHNSSYKNLPRLRLELRLRQPTVGGQSRLCLVDQDGVIRAVVTWNCKTRDRSGNLMDNWGGASKLERFWGWEAIAHGAEVVSYFRWRQCSVAQEQMHTGLCRAGFDLGDGKQVRQRTSSIPALPPGFSDLRQTRTAINQQPGVSYR